MSKIILFVLFGDNVLGFIHLYPHSLDSIRASSCSGGHVKEVIRVRSDMWMKGVLQSQHHQGGPHVPGGLAMGSFPGKFMAELSLRGGHGDGGAETGCPGWKRW